MYIYSYTQLSFTNLISYQVEMQVHKIKTNIS